MADEMLPDSSVVLAFLRSGQGVSKAELGRLSGVPVKLIHEYERGRKPLNRKRLEFLISFLGLPPEKIDETLVFLEDNRASGRPPGDADSFSESRRQIEVAAHRGARITKGFIRSFLGLLSQEGEALTARQRADFLWLKLKGRKPAERRALVQGSNSKFRTWALCEKVAAESIEAAGNDPAEALELAELALRIAERVPGEQAWRLRLQGYAGVHIANARRVCGDLRGADHDLARAKKLWAEGASGDPGLLNEAIFLGLEANLRRAQRRFREALERLTEAMAADQGDITARLLYTKAGILTGMDDLEGSTEALQMAMPLVDPRREPRFALGVRFLFLVNLCHKGSAAEAASRLSELRILTERQGKELDLIRVVWLEGKVAAGLGQREDARKAFEQVRREFATRSVPYDYALVTLELSLVLLEQGRTSQVRTLVEEMFWLFKDQGVHREALAALQVFCEAAKRDTATTELAQRVVRYLYRAQHDPELRFEEAGAKAQ